MSNLWLNVRFGLYHIQADRGWRFWRLSISRNEYHIGRNSPWFEMYEPLWISIGGRRS